MRLRGLIKHAVHSYLPGRAGWFNYYGTRVHFPHDSLVFKLTCDQGIYEKDLVNLMLQAARAGTMVFDVGANIGLMAVPILQGVPGCQVCSFEPSPNTLPYLNKTHAGAPWGDRWTIVPKAAGEQPGAAAFSIAAKALGALDGFQNTARAGQMKEVSVEVTTIDDEWLRLGRPEVSVMKIDIEGAETLALRGAKAMIEQARPVVFLEWNRENLAAYGVPAEHLLEIAAEHRCQVLAAPHLVRVHNGLELRLHMAATETFVLVPA